MSDKDEELGQVNSKKGVKRSEPQRTICEERTAIKRALSREQGIANSMQ